MKLKKTKKIRLAVSPWIGYSPLYYADEKGWLKEAGIDLVHSTSLHETVHYFQAGLIDSFVSTQFEASMLKGDNLIHLMPINRSNGGDVVLSNSSIKSIAKSKKVVVYLEVDSVNQLVFDSFIKKHDLSILNFHLINKEQVMIKILKNNLDEDSIIVTYEPYATILRNSGFIQVGSTSDTDILVLDSLYINEDVFNENMEKAIFLKSLIKKAYKRLQEDPLEYYKTVKHFMEDPTFEEFKTSLTGIQWLIDKQDHDMKSVFSTHNILPVGAK